MNHMNQTPSRWQTNLANNLYHRKFLYDFKNFFEDSEFATAWLARLTRLEKDDDDGLNLVRLKRDFRK